MKKINRTYCIGCPYFYYTDEDKQWFGSFCKKDGHSTYPSMYAIKSLHDNCPLVTEMAIQALEQTRWIPVSERLPEIGQRVLVTYNQEDKLKVDTTIFDRHVFLIGVVTAWMPLPQPYKGESEEA